MAPLTLDAIVRRCRARSLALAYQNVTAVFEENWGNWVVRCSKGFRLCLYICRWLVSPSHLTCHVAGPVKMSSDPFGLRPRFRFSVVGSRWFVLVLWFLQKIWDLGILPVRRLTHWCRGSPALAIFRLNGIGMIDE